MKLKFKIQIRVCSLLVCLLVSLLSSKIQAEALPECSVCVVDLSKIIEGSKIGRAAQSSLEREVSQARTKLQDRKRILAERRSALEKELVLLSTEAAGKKKRELREFERSLQDELQELQQNLVAKRGAASEKVLNALQSALDLLAKRGYQGVVLENDPRLVVYVSEELDLSSQLLALMDEQYAP